MMPLIPRRTKPAQVRQMLVATQPQMMPRLMPHRPLMPRLMPRQTPLIERRVATVAIVATDLETSQKRPARRSRRSASATLSRRARLRRGHGGQFWQAIIRSAATARCVCECHGRRHDGRTESAFHVWREKLSDGFVRYEVAQAREHDRDSHYGPYARLQTTTPVFERWGRRYVRMFSLDVMAEEAGAPRGGAISIKPSEATEYRMFLKEWQKVQWAREDAYDDGDGEDVPLRAVLGGMQR